MFNADGTGPVHLLLKVEVIDESLLSRDYVVNFDGLPYPGIIMDIDEDEVEVKVMSKIGTNRFFWPLLEDRLWYRREQIVTLLQTPPQPVTKRHHQIDPAVWLLIEYELKL